MGTDRVQKGTGTPILTISEECMLSTLLVEDAQSKPLWSSHKRQRSDQWCAVTFTKWQARGKLPASVLTQLQSLLMGDRYTLKMETGTVSYGCKTRSAFSNNSWLQNSAVWVWGAERLIYFGMFLFIFRFEKSNTACLAGPDGMPLVYTEELTDQHRELVHKEHPQSSYRWPSHPLPLFCRRDHADDGFNQPLKNLLTVGIRALGPRSLKLVTFCGRGTLMTDLK